MQQSGRNPELARLDALVGDWTMEATPPGGEPWPGDARATFEWLEGGTWLVERWTIEMPEAPHGIAIIGPGDGPATFRQHYFDSRGVHRIYEMTLDGGVWRMWRDATDPFAQRFGAKISDDGNTITGRWEKAPDGTNWEIDFDLTYRRSG